MTTISDTTSEILSEIVAFLETQYSPLPTIKMSSKAPPLPDNASQLQPTQRPQQVNNERPITIFIAYVSADDRFRKLLERELRTLSKQGLNITWESYEVTTVLDFITDIDNPLNERDLILLLVSPDFVTLDFCYDSVMKRTVERHSKGAWVSPVLLRPSRWERTPFGMKPLPVLPRNKRPVTEWSDEDAAFLDISEGIERGIESLR
jgi:hypothetical protein